MVTPETIKPHLDRLLARFDKTYLAPDPLAAVNHFTSADDLETACLFAALFAYGKADLIQKNVTAIIGAMGSSPAGFCETFRSGSNRSWMKGFSYRFHKRDDLVALVRAVGKIRRKHGSIRDLFLRHDNRTQETILPGLAGVADAIRNCSRADSRAFNTLVPDPLAGGASKRWNLFLRWMVRKDRVDPGPWSGVVSKSRLVIPLDTHVGRIARQLNMLGRRSDDWKAAVELTEFLKRLDPADPVKYDFAICSYGKLGYCVKKTDPSRCRTCDLNSICSRRET